MKTIFALLIAISLSACGETSVVDQCKRVELFNSCMKNLPAGPVATQYNDWAEVVSTCENVAYPQSLRSQKFVKAECQP